MNERGDTNILGMKEKDFIKQWYKNIPIASSPQLFIQDLYHQMQAEFNLNFEMEKFQEAVQQIITFPMPESEKKVQLFKSFPKENQFPVLMPKPNVRHITFSSKRKIIPNNSPNTPLNPSLATHLEELQKINNEYSHVHHRKNSTSTTKKNSVRQPLTEESIRENCLWFFHEYFYSNYDRKYFNEEKYQLRESLKQLGVHKQNWAYKEQRKLLKNLPKPKLFSDTFIQRQKCKLDIFRGKCRQVTRNLSKTNERVEFPVHSVVLALHPLSGQLHPGSVLALYKQNKYMIKFLKSELSTHKVLDLNMSTEYTGSKKSTSQGSEQFILSIPQNKLSFQLIDQLPFETTALLIRLLQFKSQLILFVKNINDDIENRTKEEGSVEIQKWLFDVLENIEKIIKCVLVRFRLRGITELNEGAVNSNLKTLLLNPLKLISKQFQGSGDQADLSAAAQIKQIIDRQRKNQIERAIKSIYEMKTETEEDFSEEMMRLLRLCLSILNDLKYEGKSFDIRKNPHLMDLSSASGSSNAEQFNEIYEILYSIVSRIKD